MEVSMCVFAACITATMASCAVSASCEAEKAACNINNGQVCLANGRLKLIVYTAGEINPVSLQNTDDGRAYADFDYAWPGGKKPSMLGKPAVKRASDGSRSVILAGKLGALNIELTYCAPADEPDTITETVRISNPSDAQVDTSDFFCGFAKKINDGTSWLGGVENSHFCNVPYRAHTETGELCDYTLKALTTKQSWYSAARNPIYDRHDSSIWGAEGWAWCWGSDTLLISKYNPDAIEWSLLEPVWCENDGARTQILRFGGAGLWKQGDPDGAASLAPGGSFTFGITRYQIVDGGWKNAFYAHRRYTESRGHRIPANYNPPVNWNELYDNPLWQGGSGDTLENREKYYRRSDMQIEAEKARDLGCESLYLDPGWDTAFGSNIWADSRLGSEADFAKWLKDNYSLSIALHTPLAPWSDPAAYPDGSQRLETDGSRREPCCSSKAYMDAKVERCIKLCRDGAYQLLFDGAWFENCVDPSHGHSVPLSHQEHIDSILKMAQRVHEACPDATIELHDPMTGPGTTRYTPTYLLHAKPGGIDEIWGYEYMNEPMDDILSHRAMSLYYVNLAYSIPIYLHTDLRGDNKNAFIFWWFASTCRHLGVGGKTSDPAVWAAQKQAMQTYLANKRFFTQGVFYGLDETIHAHTLPDIGKCVINCFNLSTEPVQKEFSFRLSDIGLKNGPVSVEGASFKQSGDEVTLNIPIPARGHELVKISL